MQSNNHMMDWLHRRGISPQVIDQFHVTIHDHPQIGECIKIPYSQTNIRKYRRDPSDERKPKYLYDQGGKVTLYGADKLSQQDISVVITEGELDTLVLWSQNIPAVSSTGGAMSFQEEWKQTFIGRRPYICFDNDDAGAKGAVKVLKMLSGTATVSGETVPTTPSVILIPELPGIKDISDYVARGFDFRDLMSSALHNLSVESVKEDMGKRKGMMLSTRFHEAYLDSMQQELHKTTYQPSTYTGDDKVLRAKSYPIDNLVDITRRKTLCLWHNDNDPSMHYYPKTNSTYCFTCGKHADAIDFYREVNGVGFKDAVKELNDKV
jgi:hypothetical protein